MTIDEMKLCTRIQRFYDLVKERLSHERTLDAAQIAVEGELSFILNELEKIFSEVIYDDK
jgi:hypothetical protein